MELPEWSGLASKVTGLFLNLGGAVGLAIGALRIEEQPVGRAVRSHDKWGTCRTFGFATEAGKYKARRATIFRGGRYIIAGCVLQTHCAPPSFFI